MKSHSCCRPGQGSTNHATQMCHYAAAGMAFRDWPVDKQQQADAHSGLEHNRPIQAFLVSQFSTRSCQYPAGLCVYVLAGTEASPHSACMFMSASVSLATP